MIIFDDRQNVIKIIDYEYCYLENLNYGLDDGINEDEEYFHVSEAKLIKGFEIRKGQEKYIFNL